MQKNKVDYILNHFSHLMTINERAAWKHWSTNYKIDNGDYVSEEQKEKRRKVSKKAGWISSDPKILGLLKEGIENFRLKTAERIFKEETVEFNCCPKCGSIARTPRAKQCRFCSYDWH